MKKLLSRATWYKRCRNTTTFDQEYNTTEYTGRKVKKSKEQDREPQTILFVDYTKDGELAAEMKELNKILAYMTGFVVKVVERAGGSLKEQFPTTTLWEGSSCGREDCITCTQGAEKLPNCKKASLVYENVCLECNPKAGAKEELKELKKDTPSVYIGETSRTIYERSKEHWSSWRSKKEESHIRKHQENDHGGSSSPKFVMRVVRNYKTALSRQIGEAVRIRRRGGGG